VVADPATFVRMGTIGAPQLHALVGLFVILVLPQYRSPLAFIAGSAVATLVGLALGLVTVPKLLFSAPDMSSVLLKLDVTLTDHTTRFLLNPPY
jgi:xanthine/uracil/vitamin C permease (AzgA family)